MMLRDIEIGQKYRLNIRPNPEYRCPVCDRMIVLNPEYQGDTVLVYQNYSGPIRCNGPDGCGKTFPVGEGFYLIRKDWKSNLAVPYTWLEEIGGNDD